MTGGLSSGWVGAMCNPSQSTISSGFGTSVTQGTNTFGTWTSIISSTASDSAFVHVTIWASTGSARTGAVNIGIGTNPNQKIIISNLVCCSATTTGCFYAYMFPVLIPAGTNIWAQASGNASGSVHVGVKIWDSNFSNIGASGVDGIGYVAGSTTGTVVTPSATANTKGSYVVFTASTTQDYNALYIAYIYDIPADTGPGNQNGTFDLAIGGTGSEQIILPDIPYLITSSNAWNSVQGPFPVNIPAGTQIQIRSQFGGATGQGLGFVVYGLYQ